MHFVRTPTRKNAQKIWKLLIINCLLSEKKIGLLSSNFHFSVIWKKIFFLISEIFKNCASGHVHSVNQPLRKNAPTQKTRKNFKICASNVMHSLQTPWRQNAQKLWETSNNQQIFLAKSPFFCKRSDFFLWISKIIFNFQFL